MGVSCFFFLCNLVPVVSHHVWAYLIIIKLVLSPEKFFFSRFPEFTFFTCIRVIWIFFYFIKSSLFIFFLFLNSSVPAACFSDFLTADINAIQIKKIGSSTHCSVGGYLNLKVGSKQDFVLIVRFDFLYSPYYWTRLFAVASLIGSPHYNKDSDKKTSKNSRIIRLWINLPPLFRTSIKTFQHVERKLVT